MFDDLFGNGPGTFQFGGEQIEELTLRMNDE